MDSIPYDFDDSRHSFTSSLFDSKSSGFCGCYSTYRGSGTLRFTVPSFDLRTLLAFDSPLHFRLPFNGFLRTISTISDTPLPPPYSIPSPVISVIAIAVTVVSGTHFTLRFPLRLTVPSSDFRTSPYLLQDQ
jgi:hypothetical protein